MGLKLIYFNNARSIQGVFLLRPDGFLLSSDQCLLCCAKEQSCPLLIDLNVVMTTDCKFLDH